MAGEINRLFVAIGARTTEFEQGMDRVQGRMQKLTAVGKKLSLGLTLPIVAIGTAAFKMAGDFDQSFRKVNVMLKASAEEAEEYKNKIIDISNATGKSASNVADAFYQIVSAGFRGADAIDILTTAMKGATGGAADETQTTAALTKAMNIFQLEGVEGANRAMDTFFGIVDTGLLSFEELAASFPRAASNAAGLGVKIEETGAMLGTLTKVLGTTEQAATAVDATLRMLISPSEAMQELFEEWGVRSGPEAIEKFGGLTGVMEELRKVTGGEVTAIRELFASDEAMKGILPLLTSSYEDYNDAVVTVTGSQGRMNEAYEEMTEGPGFQWIRMMNTMKNSMLLLGDAVARTLGPWIQKLIDWVQGAVEWFGNLDEGTQKLIVRIGLLAAALGPALLIGGALVNAIKSLIGVFVALKATLIAIKIEAALMWGAVTAGVSLAIVGIVELTRHLNQADQATEELKRQWQDLYQTMNDDVIRATGILETNLKTRRNLWKEAHFERMSQLNEQFWAELKAISPEKFKELLPLYEEWLGLQEKIAGLTAEEREARIEEIDIELNTEDLDEETERALEKERALLKAEKLEVKVMAAIEEIPDEDIDAYFGPLLTEAEAIRDEWADTYKLPFEDFCVWLQTEGKDMYRKALEEIGEKVPITFYPLIPSETPPVSGKYTPLQPIPEIPGMQFGGIVRSPALAMVGEGGPEAVIPLSQSGLIAGKGDVHIHVGYLMGDEISLRKFARQLKSILGEEGRRSAFSPLQGGNYFDSGRASL